MMVQETPGPSDWQHFMYEIDLVVWLTVQDERLADNTLYPFQKYTCTVYLYKRMLSAGRSGNNQSEKIFGT